MNKKRGAEFLLAFTALISMAAISSAQPVGQGPYPDYDPWQYQWSGEESWPGDWEYGWPFEWDDGRPYLGEYDWPYQLEEPYPTSEPTSGPYTPPGLSSDGAPTATRPEGYHPASTPSASSGSPISYLGEGAALSEQQVSSLPGGSSLMAPGGLAAPPGSGSGEPVAFQSYYGGTQPYRRYYGGLVQWIYYCGRWTYGPAALWYGQQTNTIIRNDQYQMIWSYERYPSGYEAWQFWGYWYPGYRHAWFGADAKGWHQIAVWGSCSGWSNPIWVYVW